MTTKEIRKLLTRAKSAANKAYQETTENEVAGYIEDCIALIQRIQHGIKRGASIYVDYPERGAARIDPPPRPRRKRFQQHQPDLFANNP